MKKGKIMLLSLALFAILGATLAFKAKISTIDWCYTTRALGSNATTTYCPLLLANRTFQDVGAPTVYATFLDANGNAIFTEDQCRVSLNCEKVCLIID